MTGLDLVHIAEEFCCDFDFSFRPTPQGTQELVSFYRDNTLIFGLATTNGEMPWPGYLLARALHEKCKERKV